MDHLLEAVPAITSPLALVAYGGVLIAASILSWLTIQRHREIHENERLADDKLLEAMKIRRLPQPARITGAEHLQQLRLQYRLLLSLAILFFFFAIVGIGASVIVEKQQSPAGCEGASCNGKDPGTMDCAPGAGTVDQVRLHDEQNRDVGWVDLRNSAM